jgi:hypothetical protein
VTSLFDQLGDVGRADPHAPTSQVAAPGSDGGSAGGGLDLSLFVSLGATLGTLADGLAADRERRSSMEPPGDEQIFAQGTVPSSGILVMDLGSVPLGRVWQVRRIVVGGPQANDTPTGAAFAFRQGAPPSDLNTSNMVDSWPSFTDGAQGSTYGTHQLFLRASEHLFVVTSGAVSGVRWVASAQVEDWSEANFRSSFAE